MVKGKIGNDKFLFSERKVCMGESWSRLLSTDSVRSSPIGSDSLADATAAWAGTINPAMWLATWVGNWQAKIVMENGKSVS